MNWLLCCFINIFVIITGVANAKGLQSSLIQNNPYGDNIRRYVNPLSSGYVDDGVGMSSGSQVVPDLSPYGAKWRDIVHFEDNYNPNLFTKEGSGSPESDPVTYPTESNTIEKPVTEEINRQNKTNRIEEKPSKYLFTRSWGELENDFVDFDDYNRNHNASQVTQNQRVTLANNESNTTNASVSWINSNPDIGRNQSKIATNSDDGWNYFDEPDISNDEAELPLMTPQQFLPITNNLTVNQSLNGSSGICLVGRDRLNDDNGFLKSEDEGNLNSIYTIVVEGNVASGKTTFVNLFKAYQQVMVLPEPVEEWQNVNGTDLLDLMFHNGSRYFGTFQLESTYTRLKQALKLPPPPEQNHGVQKTIRLMERSLFSERYVFLEGSHDAGLISDPEYSLMTRWFNFAVDKFEKQVNPDLIVYLRCPIDILRQRIRSRGRPEEQDFDWGFLEQTQRRYDDYLLYKNTSHPIPSKVVVLDGSLSISRFTPYVHVQLPKLFPSWNLLRGLQRRWNKRGKKL